MASTRTAEQTADLIRAIITLVYLHDLHLDFPMLAAMERIRAQLAVADDSPDNPPIANALATFRNGLGSSHQNALNVLRAAGNALGRLGGAANTADLQASIDAFNQWLHDNSAHIKSRGLTKPTTYVFTGQGAGVLAIFQQDPNGDLIDIAHPGILRFRCTQDGTENAALGQEQFTPLGPDTLFAPWQENGSGVGRGYAYVYGRERADFGGAQSIGQTGQPFLAVNADFQRGNRVRNGDFEEAWLVSATQDKIPEWFIPNAAHVGNLEQVVHPDGNNEVVNGEGSAKATDVFLIEQNVEPNTLRTRTAYSINAKVLRLDSATGTFRVRVMNRDDSATHGTFTVDLATLSNGVKTVLTPAGFVLPTNAKALKIVVDCADLAVGEIVFDDVIVAPMALVDGHLVAVHDGMTRNAGDLEGEFKNGDQFTIVTETDDSGLMQKFFNRAFRRYFRHDDSASAGWEDPDIVSEIVTLHDGEVTTGVDLGNDVPNEAQQLTITVRNDGTKPLAMLNWDTADASNMTAHGVVQAPDVLLPGQSGELILSFEPNANGAFSFDVTADTNDPDEASFSLTISGEAVDP